MAGLPKNISIVQYKNADGTKQVKYRARITVKGQKFNRLFDELAHAKTYLTEAKSHFGRKAIDEADIAEQMAFEEWKRPTFEWFIDNYFKWRFPEPPKDAPILKRKEFATYKSFFNTIKETEFALLNEDMLEDTPQAAVFFINIGLGQHISNPKTSLKALKLHQIDYRIINAYIGARLAAGKSKITVRKEISVLSCFYRDLKHVPAFAKKNVAHVQNPCKDIDYRLLAKAANKPGPKRIDKANWEKYLHCLAMEDLDFAYASLLQYFGAFRMSEALGLTWDNCDFRRKHVYLPQTKTRPRLVAMTKDLEDLLDIIEPDESKRTGLVLKTQTLYKYQKQMQRFRKQYGFQLTTHLFRKDAISRMIDKVGTKNQVMLAAILGYTNVKQFANDYLQQVPDLSTLEGVQANVGHAPASINVTANNYFGMPDVTGDNR